jgi:hypothetical protein
MKTRRFLGRDKPDSEKPSAGLLALQKHQQNPQDEDKDSDSRVDEYHV